MYIAFDEITPRTRYNLLVATVVPRPIALVTTLSADGIVNAAPFSFFNVFSEDPALAVLGLEARREDYGLKDTTANIRETGELVINLVDRPLAEPMAACAAALAPEVDELAFAGLSPHASRAVAPPGIAEAPVRLECKLFELRAITERRHLCIAEILALSARDGIIDPETHHLDLSQYTPVGRLFADRYVEVAESFAVPVPDVPPEMLETPGKEGAGNGRL